MQLTNSNVTWLLRGRGRCWSHSLTVTGATPPTPRVSFTSRWFCGLMARAAWNTSWIWTPFSQTWCVSDAGTGENFLATVRTKDQNLKTWFLDVTKEHEVIPLYAVGVNKRLPSTLKHSLVTALFDFDIIQPATRGFQGDSSWKLSCKALHEPAWYDLR